AEMKFDAEHQRQLAEAAELAGDAYAALGTDTEAEKLHRKAESVLAGLTAVSKQVRDIRDLARVYEKLLEDSVRLRHSTAVTACYEKALWTRRALTEGMRVRTGLRTKDAAELAAGGDADYAAFGADAEALEKLKGRREEIRRLAADCAPEEDRLIDRLQPGETDFAALFAGVKACADAVLREHTVPAIRQDLAYLSRTLGRIVSLGDVFDDPDVSAAQLVRSAKRIAEYIAEHYEPFFKFDENCMLVYAFCRRLYGTLSLKAALGGGTVRAPGPEIGEPVFMNYPVSEIAHEGTWQQLFNWTR
ncbi:MAG: hypothetical protein IK064_02935, partial [Clostridia bacterium]|nr:hypothetical protein [Clostridia bacterium]